MKTGRESSVTVIRWTRWRNARRRAKAEVFEDLLAAVSVLLATVARTSAETLRAERLADVASRQPVPPPPPLPVKKMTPQLHDRCPDDPGRRKQHASTRATGARRQARRDSR